jgi:hypothetical protein
MVISNPDDANSQEAILGDCDVIRTKKKNAEENITASEEEEGGTGKD